MPPARSTLPRLAALDGVRALAVLAVLAAHTGLPGCGGGFLGVDVFFVVSGFLITSLLLDEHRRTGTVRLAAFWSRRASRLLPAALLMIAAVVAAHSLLPPDAVGGLRLDALSAALWSSNWRWALHGTDYFAQGGTASPLQHTWSLAVEEQFYLIWPVILLLLWAGLRTLRARRARLLAVALGGAAVSASLTTFLSGRVPAGRVYFGTDTRAQELLVGAALAAVLAPTWEWHRAHRRSRRSPQVGDRRRLPAVLSVGGLVVLAVGVYWADGEPGEFRDGLMLGVALAAAALLAGVLLDSRTAVARLLAARPLVAIGRISYGIYLWHWPVFEVLDGARTGLGPYPLAALRFAATLAAATASLVLVERPALRLRLRLPSRRLLPAAGVGIAAVTLFSACAAPSTAPATSAPPPTNGLDAPPSLTTPASSPGSASRPSTPATTPPTTSAGRRGPLTVDVFGDSIGWTLTHYLPATPGVHVVDHTVLGCGIAQGGPYEYFGQRYADHRTCDTWPTRWRQQVGTDRPDEVLLVVGRWETMDRVYQGRWTHVGDPAYTAHLGVLLGQAIDVLSSAGAHVVVTDEPYNRRGEQPDGQLYPEDNPARVDAWNTVVRSVVAAHSSASLLGLNRKLCPDGHFTWDVDGRQVRSDGVHLTPEGVQWLTPWLVSNLRADAG